jgi:hypothetical protein
MVERFPSGWGAPKRRVSASNKIVLAVLSLSGKVSASRFATFFVGSNGDR